MKAIETKRLVLRQWHDTDRAGFAALNADSEVMKYFPSTYDRTQSDASIDRFIKSIENNRFGFFAPAIETGWRLAQQYWGQGLACEGARACLAYGFETLEIRQIVSMTPCTNLKSEKLMQRIGMRNSKQNFIYPAIAANHSLAEHVLYQMNKENWLGHS